MKKKTYFFLVLAVAAIAAMTGYKFYQKANQTVEDKQVKKIAVAVVHPERRQMLDSREFTGTLRADSSFELSPKVGGRLEELNVHLGDKIEPGDIIAKLDDTEYIQAVEQAKADLEISKAQLIEAQIALNQAEREYDRNLRLRESRVYSESQLEIAETNFKSQQAIVKMRTADVARLSAILDNAQTKLDDTVLKADWKEGERFVGQRFVDEGQLMSANQSIISVIDIDKLKAEINIVEKDYPKLKLGHTAEITTDAFPGKVFYGKVVQISKAINEYTRQGSALLEIPNGELKLRPGMFVRVRINFGTYDNMLSVPLEAVTKRNDVTGVFVYNEENGTASFIPVTTGIQNGNWITINEPENIDKPVITLGNHQIADGSFVYLPENNQDAGE